MCASYVCHVVLCMWDGEILYTVYPVCVCVCFSVCCLDSPVNVSVWERCIQSNYVIRAEPNGPLRGRLQQSAKDRLLDLFSPALCVRVLNRTPYGLELLFPFAQTVMRYAKQQGGGR